MSHYTQILLLLLLFWYNVSTTIIASNLDTILESGNGLKETKTITTMKAIAGSTTTTTTSTTTSTETNSKKEHEQQQQQQQQHTDTETETETDTDYYLETVQAGMVFTDSKDINYKYRRVCTNVGLSSILCITIRYPFDVLPQTNDSTIRYPKPVTTEFYNNYDKTNLKSIKINDWNTCIQSYYNNNNTTEENIQDNTELDTILHACFENTVTQIAKKRSDQQEPVIYMYTRRNRRKDNLLFHYHGYGHSKAVETIFNFFGTNHEILIAGASPTPGIASNVRWLFGSDCIITGVSKAGNWDCTHTTTTTTTTNNDRNRKHKRRRQRRQSTTNNNRIRKHKRSTRRKNSQRSQQNNRNLGTLPYSILKEPKLNFGVLTYHPDSKRSHHYIPSKSVFDVLSDNNITRSIIIPTTKDDTLRNFSFVVEYPIAHVQGYEMIQNEPNTIKKIQEQLAKYYLDLINSTKTNEWIKRGYQFQHLFTFDGLPQFFPTSTSAFQFDINSLSKDNFWFPGSNMTEYGSNCRGPIPNNSILKDIQIYARQLMKNSSIYNMQYYSRTWEFTNLFWYQTKMWAGKGGHLDCTHSIGGNGLYGVHPYFIQAIIDDYYENQ